MPNQESPLPKLDALVTAIHNTLQNKFDDKASQSSLEEHTSDTSTHLSSTDRTKLNDILTATDAQNTYSTIDTVTAHTTDTNIHVTAAKTAAWDNKADSVHTHSINDINGLSDVLIESQLRSLSEHELEDILVWN